MAGLAAYGALRGPAKAAQAKAAQAKAAQAKQHVPVNSKPSVSISKPLSETLEAPQELAVTAPSSKAQKQIHDIEILPSDIQPARGQHLNHELKDLIISPNSDAVVLQGKVPQAGRYQVWLTHFSRGRAELKFHNGTSENQRVLLDMDFQHLSTVYDHNDKVVHKQGHRRLKKKAKDIPPYYFREYLGSVELSKRYDFRLKYSNPHPIRVHKMELQREDRIEDDMQDLLDAAIHFYTKHEGPMLPRCTYDGQKQKFGNIASCAATGVAIMAHCIRYQLDPNSKVAKKSTKEVLKLLKMFNHKHPKVKPDRHPSGFFRHFINVKTGKGKSEFSTIDTAILISGALMARNTFPDLKIQQEADELWNSIDWAKAVVSTDPSKPRFYLTGKQIDGLNDGTISMYNEYILLAYFCQKYEDMNSGDKARSHIMPDLHQLPRTVFRNRIQVANHTQPSFLVQFPFYMSELCANDLFFSYTAAQAQADRSVGISRYGNRSFWGVSPGTTPLQGYKVDHFLSNKERVVRPRIIAGFIPVFPKASEDLYALYQQPKHRWDLSFGTILPGFVPGNETWKAWRLPGVDFSSLLFGMAAHHPKIGLSFFKEKMRFSFKKLP